MGVVATLKREVEQIFPDLFVDPSSLLCLCSKRSTRKPTNQPSCLPVGPANSGDSKGKVGESGDSKFLMPGLG